MGSDIMREVLESYFYIGLVEVWCLKKKKDMVKLCGKLDCLMKLYKWGFFVWDFENLKFEIDF